MTDLKKMAADWAASNMGPLGEGAIDAYLAGARAALEMVRAHASGVYDVNAHRRNRLADARAEQAHDTIEYIRSLLPEVST